MKTQPIDLAQVRRILAELRNPVRSVPIGFDRDWIVPAEVTKP